MLQYRINNGLQVFDRTKITEIKFNEHDVELKTEDGFLVRSKKLVNASGFEITNFISKKIVDLYGTYTVISENEQEKEALWKDRIMIWNTDNPYLYIRLTVDNRILMGGRDERFNVKTSREPYQKKGLLLCKDSKNFFRKKSLKQTLPGVEHLAKQKIRFPISENLEKHRILTTHWALAEMGLHLV